jgi:beta-lactamase regulating signal transducer with metallopeptidase domain
MVLPALAIASARDVIALFLTYVLHCTMAGCSAMLLVRVARARPAAEHRLWKMALFLPPLTATLAMLFAGDASGVAVPNAAVVLPVSEELPVIATGIVTSPVDAAVLSIALAIAGGVMQFAVAVARVQRQLRDRRTLAEQRLASSLARLAERFDLGAIELFESARVASPMAVAARAICFPAGCLKSLTDLELDAVLAHELSHLERRDPLWFYLAGFVKAALWMHPLNHYVAARLRRSAELACDDRAVDATGDALGLAKALSWFAHAAFDDASGLLPGASCGPSVLVQRVQRLAAATTTPPARARASMRFSRAAAALLASVAIGSVGLSVTFAHKRPALVADIANAPRGATAPSVDLASIRGRIADLASAEIRLEAQIDAARANNASDTATAPASVRHVELEKDLRHAREERVWLERIVTDRMGP